MRLKVSKNERCSGGEREGDFRERRKRGRWKEGRDKRRRGCKAAGPSPGHKDGQLAVQKEKTEMGEWEILVGCRGG